MLRAVIQKGLSALALLLVMASVAVAQAPVSQQFARVTAGPANGSYEGLAASRTRRRTSSQAGREMNCRTVYKSGSAIHTLKIAYENLTVSSSTPPESGSGWTERVYFAVEYPAGHFTPITWSGSNHQDVASGALSFSDYTKGDLAIPAGTDFWLRSFETSTTGGGYLYNAFQNSARGELCEDGTTGTLTNKYLGGTISAGQTRSAPVVAIVSPDVRGPSYIALGDSKLQLVSLTTIQETTTTAGAGYLGEIFGAFTDETVPFLNLTRPGGQAQNFDTFFIAERPLLGLASDYVNEFGINDIFQGGLTAAQTKTAVEAVNAEVLAAQPRAKIMMATIGPKATSTTGAWIGGADQTTNASNPDRIAYNALVRAGSIAGQNNGYAEIADNLETGRDSGKFRVHPTLFRTVTDGAISASSSTLTSATAAFTSSDIGLGVGITGAGPTGGMKIAAIQSVTDGTHVVLDSSAIGTVSGATTYIGQCSIDGLHEQPACIDFIRTGGGVPIADIVFPDTKPRPFSFTPVTAVAPSSTNTSNTVTVTGLGAATPISIANGTYSINGGSFVSTPGFVLNTDTLTLRGTASGSFSTLVNVTPTIGGVSANYGITTQSAFAFVDVLHGALSTVYTSNTFTVAAGGSISVSGASGQYSKNGGAFTSTSGSVSPGDTIAVKGTSSGSVSTHVAVTLTIGSDSDTFDITTVANSEASAFILRITADPGDTRRGLIVTFITSTKSGATSGSNIWNKLDVVKFYAAADTQSALLNWKSTSFNSTVSGSPTFTADRGYKGDGSAAYIDEGMADNDGTGNWLQNSGYLSVYVNQQGSSTGAVVGTFTTTSTATDTRIIPYTGTAFTAKVHGTGIASTNVSDGLGDSAASRTGSTAMIKYRNGAVSGGNQGTASNATVSAHIFTLKANGTFSDHRVAAVMIGAGLAANENADLYAAELAYLTAIGAN